MFAHQVLVLSEEADSRRIAKHPQYFKLAYDHSGGFFNDITNRQWLVKLDIHCNEARMNKITESCLYEDTMIVIISLILQSVKGLQEGEIMSHTGDAIHVFVTTNT